MKQHNKIRIIAGKWKRRHLPIKSLTDLRPSPDVVRETLFNWLQWDIEGAHCLDLFAGSGALGFEAASRGAHSVSMVETHPIAIRQLKHNRDLLDAKNIDIIRADAMRYMAQCTHKFDIIFLDPPYASDYLPKILNLIESRNSLRENGKLYVERKKSEIALALPDNWHIIRQTTCGLVQSFLIATSNAKDT